MMYDERKYCTSRKGAPFTIYILETKIDALMA